MQNTGQNVVAIHRLKLFAAAAVGIALGITSTPIVANAQTSTDTMLVRLNGENTVGTTMVLGLAKAWARELKLGPPRVELGADQDRYEVIAQGAESSRGMHVKVQAKGHGFGLEPLLRGETDFWMAAAAITEADLETMRQRGVPNVPTLAEMTKPGVENVIALSALNVIVGMKNPTPSLLYQQLRDIFAGKVTAWGQVGGPSNLPIGIYAPEATMATAGLFCARVLKMGGDTQKCLASFPRLAAPPITLMEDLSDAVAGNPAGIGFVDFAARRSARLMPIADQCGSAIEASPFRIKSDEYPITRKHFFYTAPHRPLSPAAQEFLKLTLGPIGQAAASAAGLADLTPSLADRDYGDARLDTASDAMTLGATKIRASDTRSFRTAVADADRLTITFRFKSGTNDLDSRAEADVKRLSELMQRPPYNQYGIRLIGYSAAIGDYDANLSLSRQRATSVRERLVAEGLHNVSAIGVGPAAAVTCNLDPASATLNQRVEVWLYKPTGSGGANIAEVAHK